MFDVFLIENPFFVFFFLRGSGGTGAVQGGQQGHPMLPKRVWLKAGESLQICGVSPSSDVPFAETGHSFFHHFLCPERGLFLKEIKPSFVSLKCLL